MEETFIITSSQAKHRHNEPFLHIATQSAGKMLPEARMNPTWECIRILTADLWWKLHHVKDLARSTWSATRRKREIENASRVHDRRSSQPLRVFDIRGASRTYLTATPGDVKRAVKRMPDEEGVNNLSRHSSPPTLFSSPRPIVKSTSSHPTTSFF
jgi:hypothetical protein